MSTGDDGLIPASFARLNNELASRMADTVVRYIQDLLNENQSLKEQLKEKRQMPKRARDGKFLAKRRT
jgi:hypothetical protein